jgi:predicted membrane chloride channel (bestrophin family)
LAPFREVFLWLLNLIQREVDEGNLTAIHGMLLSKEVNAMRGNLGCLFDFEFQPIPFLYVHMANILLFVLMPLLGMHVAAEYTCKGEDGDGWACDWWSPQQWKKDLGDVVIYAIFFVLCSFFYIGLKVMGTRLGDPLGNDLCDFCLLVSCAYIPNANAITSCISNACSHSSLVHATALPHQYARVVHKIAWG